MCFHERVRSSVVVPLFHNVMGMIQHREPGHLELIRGPNGGGWGGEQRTRTVGRVQLPNRWSLDMGIVEADAAPPTGPEVHVTVGDLIERLPEEERDHWLAHLVSQPLSAAFVQMKMSAAACIDDGDTVSWT